MRDIRVLHLYRTYFPETQGGGQESIRQLCLATGPQGVTNTIFTLAHRPDPVRLQLPEAHVIRAKSWLELASCDIGASAAFRRCRLAADEADIIQVHYPWPFADVLLPFIRRKSQPVVVTYISDIVRQAGLAQLYEPLRKRLMRNAAHVVASSPNYALSSPALRQHRGAMSCIPHCLGTGEAPTPQRCAHWRKELGQPFFLFVGVLRYYKGLDYLIQAASQVKAPIVVVGEGPEGERLETLAQQLGAHNVVFLGHVSDADKLALMAACHAVVFPSHLRSEAFGMTLLEGARAAKPLICCEIGSGTTWINQHEQTGLVVPPCDPAALAQAMQRLLADPTLATRLGQQAKSRWLEMFTPEVVGRTWRKLYDQLLHRRALV